MAHAPPTDVFSRERRRSRRDRAARLFADHDFLIRHLGTGLLDRLDMVKRRFTAALDLGCHDGWLGQSLAERGMSVVSADAGYRFARAAGGVQCDEDRLPFAEGSFDLVLSAGVLDQVNDLPGALALIRRLLKPDGLFLGSFVGAGSLALLRSSLIEAEIALGGSVAPRIHPQIDVRAAGDLLTRAGLTLPVAEGETLAVRYGDPWRLISDLRGMAATNLLTGSATPIGRRLLSTWMESVAGRADDDGRITETFELIYLTAWAPSPDQPQPARRGSGQASLAAALSAKDDQKL